MRINDIEVKVQGPYTEHHGPFGRVTLSVEKRYCFWRENDKKRSCSIVKDAVGDFVSGTFYPMPRAKTIKGVLRKVVGKGLCPLT
jgi:hypothetical protein